MKLEQEIIEMENFYQTATLEEAFAYFKMKSAQCFAIIKEAISEIKSIIRGICRFFTNTKLDKGKIRSNIDLDMIYSNTFRNTSVTKLDIYDLIAMEELLVEAQTLLIKK